MLRKGRRYHTPWLVYVYFDAMSLKFSLLLCVLLIGCSHKEPTETVKSNATTKPTTAPVAANVDRSLFDGKTLTNWQTAEFGAHGIADGKNILAPVIQHFVAGIASDTISDVTIVVVPPGILGYSVC